MDALSRLRAIKVPFAETLGITFTAASSEQVSAEMVVREDLCTLLSTLHGGAIMAFADTLGAVGTFLNLPDDAATTTVESKTNFFRPLPAGTTAMGIATPIHMGRRTMVWQTRITNEDGKLAALVTQTQMVLAKDG